MKKFTKGLCLSTAIVAAGAMMSTSVSANGIFVVDEGSVAGVSNDAIYTDPIYGANKFQADEITGIYNEVVQFGAIGTNTFDVKIHMQLTGYSLDGTSLGVNQLSAIPNVGTDYGMYGLFSGSGTYMGSGLDTVFTFITGGYDLFIDPDSNSILTKPAAGTFGDFTVAATGNDDYLIASGALLSGGGTLLGNCVGDNCGAFGTDLTTVLTTAGEAFFIQPDPFFDLAFTSGDFTKFIVAAGGIEAINGKISIVFEKVPEPATLALFGLGLAGMAGVARRKAKQA